MRVGKYHFLIGSPLLLLGSQALFLLLFLPFFLSPFLSFFLSLPSLLLLHFPPLINGIVSQNVAFLSLFLLLEEPPEFFRLSLPFPSPPLSVSALLSLSSFFNCKDYLNAFQGQVTSQALILPSKDLNAFAPLSLLPLLLRLLSSLLLFLSFFFSSK